MKFITSADAEAIFSHQRGATEKEALRLLELNAVAAAKDVGKNIVKIFFSAERSFYTKGTVRVRKTLPAWL